MNEQSDEIVTFKTGVDSPKDEKDESFNLLILTLLSCLIAPFGLFIVPFILKVKKKSTHAKLILIACLFSMTINLFVVYSVVGDYLGFGTVSIEYEE
ncbi:hypothetical protein [Marinilactibacillus kalidii]|uniref:hypothetical protein n=1 Tax=Marinilactibacillus kalidii TaxID=2820274 RepID=UPI001ABDD933|nr:hypothetical protein [Marinilactibacillus kalidii]